MCSYFTHTYMENYQGDLADIVRASGGTISSVGSSTPDVPVSDWRFDPSVADGMKFQSGLLLEEPTADDFGDPFSEIRDPLLDQFSAAANNSSGFYNSNNNSTSSIFKRTSVDRETSSVFGGVVVSQKMVDDEEMMKRPCNIFSRMLQISPNTRAALPVSPCGSPVLAASPREINANNTTTTTTKGCLIDGTGAGMQISSPRNPGIKRRKSQAKKVVCIPAPAPANSRPSGEVVPSDLWAWRKYGQKPIKGSPYPRGYYRCSSSKGCSARKQVERSRTDPNMLVITYTSEHNHPWPTQRNALAGSTRSQPNSKTPNSKNLSPISPQSQMTTTNLKEESMDQSDDSEYVSPSNVAAGGGSSSTSCCNNNGFVKEEIGDLIENQLDMDDQGDEYYGDQGGFSQSYKPALPDSSSNQAAAAADQDFFAELGEIEADPLNLLLNPEFNGGDHRGDRDHSKAAALDPFNIFDWSVGNNNTTKPYS